MTHDRTAKALAPSDVRNVNLFWARVAIGESTECWPWLGNTEKNKYGAFKFRWNGRQITLRPNRVAYVIGTGKELPSGLFVMHSCDNLGCCNPSHLSPGTRSDNVRDMNRKGRGRPLSAYKRGGESPLAHPVAFQGQVFATMSEAAWQAGVSRQTMRKWIAKGLASYAR